MKKEVEKIVERNAMRERTLEEVNKIPVKSAVSATTSHENKLCCTIVVADACVTHFELAKATHNFKKC